MSKLSIVLACLAATATAQTPKILLEKNVEARMRDGVLLRADVYRPDTVAKLPALLERTPYSKATRGNIDVALNLI